MNRKNLKHWPTDEALEVLWEVQKFAAAGARDWQMPLEMRIIVAVHRRRAAAPLHDRPPSCPAPHGCPQKLWPWHDPRHADPSASLPVWNRAQHSISSHDPDSWKFAVHRQRAAMSLRTGSILCEIDSCRLPNIRNKCEQGFPSEQDNKTGS